MRTRSFLLGPFGTALVATTALVALVSDPQEAAAKGDDGLALKAKLLEIAGSMPPDDLYDYAFVMKYRAIGGKLDKQELYVAHYKPRQPRSAIRGKMRRYVRGTLNAFRVGDTHRLVLIPKTRKVWRGAMVDPYFSTDRTKVRHWALVVDLERTKK